MLAGFRRWVADARGSTSSGRASSARRHAQRELYRLAGGLCSVDDAPASQRSAAPYLCRGDDDAWPEHQKGRVPQRPVVRPRILILADVGSINAWQLLHKGTSPRQVHI